MRRGEGNGPEGEARRALYLPDGYHLDETTDPDMPMLRRPDDSVVTAFSARSASREEIEAAAWEDARPEEGNP